MFAEHSSTAEAAPSREPFMRWLLDGAGGPAGFGEGWQVLAKLETRHCRGQWGQEWQGKKQDE
jgi:hypothetical protein